MQIHTTRPQFVARLSTIALWAVGSAYLIKSELVAPQPDWVLLCSTPVVWAVIISLPILATYARRDGQWVAMALIWCAAIAGSVYTLQATLGRQAETRDVRVEQAQQVAADRSRLMRDLSRNQAMLREAQAKCGSGRTCFDSTRATIRVYEQAVAGVEAKLAALQPITPAAGERRIAALISAVSGADRATVSEAVGLALPALFGIVVELAAFSLAMYGWHPVRSSVQPARSVQFSPPPSPPAPKPRHVYRKDEARADVVQFSRPMEQADLAARWNVSKAMVSMWLAEWETAGIVQRERSGKTKTVRAKLRLAG